MPSILIHALPRPRLCLPLLGTVATAAVISLLLTMALQLSSADEDVQDGQVNKLATATKSQALAAAVCANCVCLCLHKLRGALPRHGVACGLVCGPSCNYLSLSALPGFVGFSRAHAANRLVLGLKHAQQITLLDIKQERAGRALQHTVTGDAIPWDFTDPDIELGERPSFPRPVSVSFSGDGSSSYNSSRSRRRKA